VLAVVVLAAWSLRVQAMVLHGRAEQQQQHADGDDDDSSWWQVGIAVVALLLLVAFTMVLWVSVVALQMAESSKQVQLIRCQGLWLDLAGVARSMACMEVGRVCQNPYQRPWQLQSL